MQADACIRLRRQLGQQSRRPTLFLGNGTEARTRHGCWKAEAEPNLIRGSEQSGPHYVIDLYLLRLMLEGRVVPFATELRINQRV